MVDMGDLTLLGVWRCMSPTSLGCPLDLYHVEPGQYSMSGFWKLWAPSREDDVVLHKPQAVVFLTRQGNGIQ